MYPHANEEIQKELATGERLLWNGSPLAAEVNRGFFVALFFLLGWTGITGVGTVALIASEGLTVSTSVPLVFPLIGCLALLFLLVVEPMVRRNIRYALTDRRVMIFSGVIWRRAQSLSLDAMTKANVRFDERHGVIHFLDFPYECGEDNDMVCTPRFEQIPDARQVVALISGEIDNLAARSR